MFRSLQFVWWNMIVFDVNGWIGTYTREPTSWKELLRIIFKIEKPMCSEKPETTSIEETEKIVAPKNLTLPR